MSTILNGQELTRKFILHKNGKKIELEDIDPFSPPQDVLKFYSAQYPELNNSGVDAPLYQGDEIIFNIKSTIGTKG